MPNSEEALAKAELAHKIALLIQNKGLTQVQTGNCWLWINPRCQPFFAGVSPASLWSG